MYSQSLEVALNCSIIVFLVGLVQLLNSINLRQWKVSIVTAFRKHPYTVCAVKRKFAHTVCVQMLSARRHDADFAHV